ncbi:MAG: response regulator [Clostridia bacterium]|nr:response regulator [Clostridia bacterium]
MINFLIYAMVFLGSALMIYNIYGFISYAHHVQKRKSWSGGKSILYIPIILLIFFFLGYLAVGFFGQPDLIVSGILFGGSIFVFIIYRLIEKITKRIAEGEHAQAKLIAAEESDRAKMNFLSSISHEMRTPMNVIIGLDSVALTDPDISDKTRSHLKKIGLSANHLLGLINNILNMNRIESGELVTNNVAFSLKGSVDQINAIVNTLCDSKGLTYAVTGSDNLEGVYFGDETLIRQVLISILENAVKYTDAPGSVALHIGNSGERDGARLFRFDIKDTGIGMDEEFLSKLFTVFSQEDSSSTNRFGGSGLSLAVTKKMIEVIGGEIAVESKKGVGSTFTVTIPLIPAKSSEAPAGDEGDTVSLEGRRVLIVEDLPENAEIVADLLELEGVESDHADNGQIGVDMFASSPVGCYDAVLMDLRMPVMDGLTATREIRKLGRADAATVPIIALTANAFDSDVKQSFEAGMNAHLAKPADSDTLYATLKKLIAQNEMS